MGRINNKMYDGYYMNKAKKENDKYDGLFSKRQLADLEGETELKKTEVSSNYTKSRIREQRLAGFGQTMQKPIDFSDF